MGIKPKKTKAELKKQLKNAEKKAIQASKDTLIAAIQKERDAKPQPFDYYLVCDVEGTCCEDSGFTFESEIIEFPVILVRGSDLEVLDIFHRYCRPLLNPKLSDFCLELTGISQETVDGAQPFDVVYKEFNNWLGSKCIDRDECCFVTDGPFDLRDFIEKEFTYFGIERPEYMYRIIDIRKAFAKIYEKSGNLEEMLSSANMVFDGKPHSGLDDSKNICKIFIHLAGQMRMEFNTNLRKNKLKRADWSKLRKPFNFGSP